jgi:hypothetical protein
MMFHMICVFTSIFAVSALPRADPNKDLGQTKHMYPSGGVHNDEQSHTFPRKHGEPQENPELPQYFSTEWVMYRVFQNYLHHPPPYSMPPSTLSTHDYEISYGASYYDDEYRAPDGDGHGAMMEYYQHKCLPIFDLNNSFSCAFVSLGNKAYFLRYEDRPADTPECCQFSLMNHPPRRDFIKHLPYDKDRSSSLGNAVQAYANWGPRTDPSNFTTILFGYSFYTNKTVDSYDANLPPYQHPHSFFFSGVPVAPANAPVVSQNFMNFRAQRPSQHDIWDQVIRKCPAEPQWCCLFDCDCPSSCSSDDEEDSSEDVDVVGHTDAHAVKRRKARRAYHKKGSWAKAKLHGEL